MSWFKGRDLRGHGCLRVASSAQKCVPSVPPSVILPPLVLVKTVARGVSKSHYNILFLCGHPPLPPADQSSLSPWPLGHFPANKMPLRHGTGSQKGSGVEKNRGKLFIATL